MKSLKTWLLSLGDESEGTEHWWHQRLSAVAMIPLTLWFIFAIATLGDYSYPSAHAFVSSPINAILLLVFIGTLLSHSAFGTQVVIEDYVRVKSKVVTMILTRVAFMVLGAVAVFCLLRILFG